MKEKLKEVKDIIDENGITLEEVFEIFDLTLAYLNQEEQITLVRTLKKYFDTEDNQVHDKYNICNKCGKKSDISHSDSFFGNNKYWCQKCWDKN